MTHTIEPCHEVVARKVHRCQACYGLIEKGTRYVTWANVERGEGHYRGHLHINCHYLTRNWTEDDWEGGDTINHEEIRREAVAELTM